MNAVAKCSESVPREASRHPVEPALGASFGCRPKDWRFVALVPLLAKGGRRRSFRPGVRERATASGSPALMRLRKGGETIAPS